ncbi:MAG: hypothetical protein AVDCRST_MAG50-372 [uncultured Acidimicrobiales bacterium]|uniref:Glycosyltransferase RgtA/B/C/D-like domain-containing protein n=1 Tax=uncultured Acidimicrobiales bacterium TaxID=310071 RepID=A0A6J4H8F4_9ACTN|nr:MAG: hypothetical protein AVDCRST_MAG50-372 [uncultured Acidimicrobiales bacterium]
MRLAMGAVVTASALVPFAASLADVGRGWLPVADTAIVVTRARDVFTADSPLLGQPSTAGDRTGVQVHHPGPLEFWVIGAAQKLVDRPATSLVAITVVNAVATLCLLWWLRRLGGIRTAALSSPIVVALLWSLRGDILVSPLNPLAAILPLSATLVCLVAASSGRRWALAWAVVLGSYAAQAHLTVTGLVGAAALTTTGVALGRWVLRRRSPRTAAPEPRSWRRPLLVAAALLVACWAGPLVDVVVNRGGNVVALVSTGAALDDGTLGWARAADVSVRALAGRPVWARPGVETRALGAPATTGQRWFVVGLWCIGLAGAAASRRRAPAVGIAFATATAVLVTGTLLMTRIPDNLFNVIALGNYLWLWPAGAFLWASATAGCVVAAAPRTARSLGDGACLAAVGVACSLAVACVVTPNPRPVPRAEATYTRVLSTQLATSLDRGSVYVMDIDRAMQDNEVALGVLLELVRQGFEMRVNGFAPSFGPRRSRAADADGGVLVLQRSRVGADAGPPGPGANLIAEHTPSDVAIRELAEAEDALTERIRRVGGASHVVALPELHDEGTSDRELVEGSFLGFQQTGFVTRDVAAWPETAALVRARSAPVDLVTVHLVPATPATAQQR